MPTMSNKHDKTQSYRGAKHGRGAIRLSEVIQRNVTNQLGLTTDGFEST